jgi:hypothetical protein
VKKRTAGLLAAFGTLGLIAVGIGPAGAATTGAAPTPVIATVRLDTDDSPAGFELFKMKLTEPAVIADAKASLAGTTHDFPIGDLATGTAENTGYTWHLINVHFTNVTIELCDGTPSYVENHQSDFATYCPWGARVVDIQDAS